MYSVRIVTDRQQWEQCIYARLYSPFVQSYKYGEFYVSLGETYWMVGVFDEDDMLVGGSLVVTTHAKRGNFFYLPYGPHIDPMNMEMVQMFLSFLTDFAKKEGMDFIRVSPLIENSDAIKKTFAQAGLRPAPMHVLAENTWMLDLSPDTDVLLSGMKKNHRNLIRRCEKEGVTVRMSTNLPSLNILHDMLDETGKRLHFTRFSRKYINAEFEQFAKDNQASLFISYLPDGRPDAAAIIVFYGNTAVYRHSASLHLDKKIPTSYLIQWSVIQEAKRRGMTWYNFWGVEPMGAGDTHPFAGIGHFKRGFGGFQEDVLHCHDLPLTKRYWINWIVETLRKIKRGF